MPADFSGTPLAGTRPLDVAFTDLSALAMPIVKWYWDHGDGFFSFEQDHNHIYKRSGVYTVSLTVWDDGGNKDTETKVAYITVTSPTLELQKVCLRYATEYAEGQGWCYCEGHDWVEPEEDWGTLKILDEYDAPRQLVMDRNDDITYELDTYDRLTEIKSPPLDKEDVEDTEIDWEKHYRSFVVANKEHKKLEHDVSHLKIEPEDPGNRGQAGYTAAGLRSALTIDLEAYIDGEKTTPDAVTDDVPADGDAVFSGSVLEGREVQIVVKGTAGEARVTEANTRCIAKLKSGNFTERTMSEQTWQLEMAQNRVVHLSRGSNLLLNRVDQETLAGSYTAVAGPDGRAGSAMLLTTAVNLDNAAIGGLFTLMLWTTTAAPGPIAGTVMVQYGATVGGWRLLYNRGGGGIADSRTIANGTRAFDVNLLDGLIMTDAMLASYYRDVTINTGYGYLPGGVQ